MTSSVSEKAFKSSHSKRSSSSTKRSDSSNIDMSRVASIILGGGQGTRLFPLTHARSKPATHFGGRYRLIDIPVSNSINSGIFKIFVVTQFLSSSLHNHIFQTYRFDSFSSGFVDVLSAEQKPTSSMWFQGTADAVRQNLEYFCETPVDYFLVLSGDQLYNFDFREMMRFARESDSDLVVACLPVGEGETSRMGVMSVDKSSTITDFHEKPTDPSALAELRLSSDSVKNYQLSPPNANHYLASMGIYLFKRDALFSLLAEDVREDFGKHLIPAMVKNRRAKAFLYKDYWEDIGTIEAFHRANLSLTEPGPSFRFYDEGNPIYSARQNLPGSKIGDTHVKRSIICEGSIIEADEVSHTILGTRSFIGEGSVIRDSYIMGNDFYNAPIRLHNKLPETLGIGKNCVIHRAIIDRNVRIGDGVQLINKNNLSHYNGDNIYIRDGIIVVAKGADLPGGFVL